MGRYNQSFTHYITMGEKLLNRKHIEKFDRMDSDLEPPKYEDVVLTPPNSSVFTVSAPGQYNIQIPDQSPPPQLSKPQVKFSDEAQCVSCPICQQEVMTKVSSEVSSCGLTWAILCCCFGSCILSCLVCLLPDFRRYTHSCPLCRAIIAKTEPRLSACSIICILLLAAFLMFLTIIIVSSQTCNLNQDHSEFFCSWTYEISIKYVTNLYESYHHLILNIKYV